MENINKRSINSFYQYEFFGIAFLTLACNTSNLIQDTRKDLPETIINYQNLVYAMFFVSFWCWDLSSAHFNPAITLGRLVKEVVSDY